MRQIICLLLLVVTLSSCKDRKNQHGITGEVPSNENITQAKNSATTTITDTTTVELIDSAYNFGTIKEGQKVEYSFRFKNSGKNPLVITSASASCGCTVPEKPEQPIKPGEIGYIKVVFNSKGKPGENHKNITVSSNAYPPFPDLVITGMVSKAEE
jgi:hypothetical protein